MRFLPKLKARIDRKNAEYLAGLPVDQRDQIEKASETFRGTAREWWKMRRRRGPWN